MVVKDVFQEAGLVIKTAIILAINSDQDRHVFIDLLSDLTEFKSNG